MSDADSLRAHAGSLDFGEWLHNSEYREERVSPTPVERLHALLDAGGGAVDCLPPLGHWLYCTDAALQRDLGQDGHPRPGELLPPFISMRRMWAGSAITFHSPIVVGEVLGRHTTVESITSKSGSSGPLVFVELRHEYRSAGSHALTETQTLVYREHARTTMPSVHGAAARPEPEPREVSGWDWMREAHVDETMLFRYSAVTFNAHRIHYDRDYAVHAEGYPGLVVHGPLSATLLMTQFQREHPAARPMSFRFSARAPVFAHERLRLAGRRAETAGETTGTDLALLRPNGTEAMNARVHWA